MEKEQEKLLIERLKKVNKSRVAEDTGIKYSRIHNFVSGRHNLKDYEIEILQLWFEEL